ncbi:hypothetical protein BCR39DRAFT_96852 [Naematelia encephala]|uniref:Uncharacterized protein n=1 Tax=Naematelia encephala TaxID=71784 RepID=A0A1Y2B8X3_9TREE|nr:hypothetical protein BCR39DRAFT_96852 [Naematelia encephala]
MNMTSVSLSSQYDQVRPQSHQGIHSSPAESPRIQRPSSQASLHLPPTNFSPSVDTGHSPHPLTAYPGAHSQPQYRFYQPNLSLPYPTTAPPMPFYPTGPTPMYDPRGAQPMMRTISHAHPMNSATDHTESSRYSSSPHSAGADAPATASIAPPGYPMFQMQGNEPRIGHINPALFNNSNNNYPMSRSTSGASDTGDMNTRLLTPHYTYREELSPGAQDLRKVSDSLGRMSASRFFPQNFTPSADLNGHALGFAPHTQPDSMYLARGGYTNEAHFALSAERGDIKPDATYGDNEYERERVKQIHANRRLLEEVGLGGGGGFARPHDSNMNHDRTRKASTPLKKRLASERVRASPRLASLHRNVSYADLDGGAGSEPSDDDEDQYSMGDVDDEDEFRPTKKSKGSKGGYGRKTSYSQQRVVRRVELSLWGLLEVFPEIPRLFPLFYYTLNNDLTINSDSVPLIGSIPSTVTPLEKGDTLQAFFHRGRRVLAQIDAFTSRCDRKYEGPEEKWPEMDYHTRIAIRDVRRKVVERCENYKYTRRDILDKVLGKNKWQPIEHGLIDWRPGMVDNDPAGDLANVTLTLPTPPPSVYAAQQRQAYPNRTIRPFPSRTRPVSITMGEPESAASAYATPSSATPMLTAHGFSYAHQQTSAPMYGEDQVPMSVQLPSSTTLATPEATLAPPPSWDDVKTHRSDDELDVDGKGHDDSDNADGLENLWHG